MKYFVFTLFTILIHTTARSCEFIQNSFCNTINIENPNNVILRGYFSEAIDNGLVFTRLETLKGEEDRNEIKVWDNLPFDCNGIHERLASFLGNMNQEIIISVAVLDTFIFEGEVYGDYRTPEGVWWETHSLTVVNDSVIGYIYNDSQFPYNQEMHYDDFVDDIVNNGKCSTTSTHNSFYPSNIKIYPSLLTAILNLEYEQNVTDSFIEVYNQRGQKKHSSKISPQIYLGLLTKGIYVILIHKNGKLLLSKKIVKI